MNDIHMVRIRRSQRDGLQLPVGRLTRYFKQRGYAKRVGVAAPVYMPPCWITSWPRSRNLPGTPPKITARRTRDIRGSNILQFSNIGIVSEISGHFDPIQKDLVLSWMKGIALRDIPMDPKDSANQRSATHNLPIPAKKWYSNATFFAKIHNSDIGHCEAERSEMARINSH